MTELFNILKTTIRIDSYGHKYYMVNGELHREDGPAVVYTNGGEEWYQNGELHRLDGPAINYVGGFKEWRQYGELHREDGPARIYGDSNDIESTEWYIRGELIASEEIERLRRGR